MLMGCMLGLAGLASCTDGYESEPVENFTLDYEVRLNGTRSIFATKMEASRIVL